MSRGFRHRDAERGLAVTTDTIFAIGSSTKAFTATLIGALVDDGLLEWDTPLRRYLPTFVIDQVLGLDHVQWGERLKGLQDTMKAGVKQSAKTSIA